MSTPSFIYFLAILFVGATCTLRVTGRKVSVRNATALAMVATWFACRLIYEATGEGMPLQGMVLSDCVVIAAMFCKDDLRYTAYETVQKQLAAMWHERTPWDKAILALFPAVWIFYAPVTDGRSQYWTLYGIGLVQLALAGWEAFYLRLQGNGQTPRADAPDIPPGSLFAPARGEAYA